MTDATTDTAAGVPVATGAATAAETAEPRHRRKVRRGVVVSKSGDKTLVVRAERRRRHPQYGKVIRQFKKYHVHDERNEAKVGDTVEIIVCRPLSALMRWRLVAVAASAAGAQQA